MATANTMTGIDITEDNSLDFSRGRNISGWQDATALVPNEPNDQVWSRGEMSCIWRQRRTVTIACQNGWTGTPGSETSERHFTATSPVNGQWSGWESVSIVDPVCTPPDGDSDGGDGGDGGGGGGGGNCLILKHWIYGRWYIQTS